MKCIFFKLFYRDFLLYTRNISECFSIFLFYTIVTSLFIFTLSDDSIFLRKTGVCVIWVNVLLSILLSLDGLFKVDYESGVLDQFIISTQPLYFLIYSKILALWIFIFLPLVVIAPLLSFLFGLYLDEAFILSLSLLLGTPVLAILGVIGASLVLSLNRGGILLIIIILPLCIPILIFGISSVLLFIVGEFPFSYFSMLLSLSIIFLIFGPFIVSASLRVNYYL